MKKLLTLFTLLLTVCSGAWGDEVTATLINQSTGVVNSTDFKTTLASKSGTYTCGVYGTFTKYIQMGGAVSTPIEAYQQDRVIRYDVLTNSVTVDVYAYNKANSDYKLYVSMIEEGDAEAKDIDIKEFTVTKKSGDKFTWTFTPTTNASIYIHVSNNSNVYICQAEVTDNGATTLKQGGEIGYTANLTLCRIANNKALTSMDGIEYNATSNSIKVLTSGNPVKLKATTEYIKFTLNETEKVSINASGTYSVTTNDTYQSGSAVSGNQNIILDAGTYYICPNGSNVTFASLSFLAPPSLYTVTYNLNGGTGTTPSESDKAEGAKFTLHDGVTDITAPDGKKFVAWNDGTNNYDGGALYTMPGENVTLTAQWANKYTITKHSTTHGTIAVSATEAVAGEEITLTATPDFRYVRGSWMVYKTGDPTTTTYVNSNNKFIMPAYDVTVDAIFTADPHKQVLYVTSDGNVNANDKLYAALSEDYTVTKAAYNADKDVTDFDLVVLHESIGGGNYDTGLVKDAKGANVPLLNTKSYFYGADKDATDRWKWGAPNAGKSVKGATLNTDAFSNIADHPIFAGVTISTNFFEITDEAAAKCMQPVGSFVAGKEGFTLATTPNAESGNGAAIHELTPAQRGATSGKYLLISVSSAKLNDLNANGQKLFKNAAAYLISDDQWIPTVPVTVTSAEWATATTPNWPVEFDENAKVYVVASAEGSIKLTQITEAPANTPIIVNAPAGSYNMTKKAEATTDVSKNLLMSSDGSIVGTDTESPYVLGKNLSDVVGFGPLAKGVTLAAGKAYIPATALANAVDFLPFVIGDEESETTSIKAVETAEVSGTVYNLAGQKVGKDYKGIVIVNGKKVIRK